MIAIVHKAEHWSNVWVACKEAIHVITTASGSISLMGGSDFILCIQFSGYRQMGRKNNQECILKSSQTGAARPVGRKFLQTVVWNSTLHGRVLAILRWFP